MKTITLATLAEATDQEVFDQVATHLLKQNQSSESECGTSCMYRGKGGLKCAAGCLISDDEYSEKLENTSWPYLVKRELVPSKHCELITSLQQIHDREYPPAWPIRLAELAKQRGLTMPTI